MRLKSLLIVIGGLMLVLTACSGDEEEAAPAAPTQVSAPVAAAPAPTAVPTTPPAAPTAEPTQVPASPTAAPPPATATPMPTATATPTPNPFASVDGIVDPDNHGWPREVEGLNGRVTIDAKPARIHTVSLGHDEMTYALVPAERVVAVGKFTQNPVYSNVAALAKEVPGISRDAEQIVSHDPDIVMASPFAKAELLEALGNVGITVVQTQLHNDPEGRILDILFLGYVYGEEERALELVEEVRGRFDELKALTDAKPEASQLRVMSLTSYSDKLYTAGSGSTEGSIIQGAGGINVAAEAGIERNKTTSLEGVISMQPDLVILPQPADSGGDEFRDRLLNDPALAEVPAIRDGRVYLVPPKFFTTLSFWNIRGAEELAKLLWPDDLGDTEFASFSFPE